MRKKRLFSLLLALVLCWGLLPIAAHADESVFAGGSGTRADPYLIETAAQLNEIRNNLSKHFKLVNNIVFQASDFAQGGAFYNDGAGWISIGDENDAFNGSLDGNGKYITGLRQNFTGTASSEKYYGGLFGKTNFASVKNLNLSAVIQADGTGTFYLGGIAGCVNGLKSGFDFSISNCSFSGAITCKSDSRSYVGGIAGFLYSANPNSDAFWNCYIDSCVNSGSIQSNAGYLGGITGYSGRITNCCNKGTITGNTNTTEISTYAGGISGYSAIISQCYNTASITGTYAGGILGAYSHVSQSYNIAKVTGRDYAGGITGYQSDFTMQNCYNAGTVSSQGYSGGIVGWSGKVKQCYNIGAVSGNTIGTIWGSTESSVNSQDIYYLESGNIPDSGGHSSSVVKPTIITTSCTDAQMRQQSTFSGFDFDTIWTMEGSSYYPYPKLKNVTTVAETAKLTGLTINGDTSATVPYKDAITVKLTATATYKNSYVTRQQDVTNSATWSIVGSPTGVSISKGTVSIDSSADEELITVQASYSGKKVTHDIALTKEAHQLTEVPAVAATCKATGTIAHWHCSTCGKNFSDSAGTVELTTTIVPIAPNNHAGGVLRRKMLLQLPAPFRGTKMISTV